MTAADALHPEESPTLDSSVQSCSERYCKEEAARQKKSSVAELLDQIVRDWLARQQALEANEAAQQRLHDEVLKTVGTIRGNNPDRASNAKALLRAKLAQQRAD